MSQEDENRAIAEAAARWGKAREAWKFAGSAPSYLSECSPSKIRSQRKAHAKQLLKDAADALEATLRAAGRL